MSHAATRSATSAIRRVSQGAAYLDELLRRRHSTRAFLAAPLPRKMQERLLSMAQRTATWCNAQPWHVTMVAGETLTRLREDVADAVHRRDRSFDIAAPIAYDGLYAARRRECAAGLHEVLGIRREDKAGRVAQAMKNYDFFDAPHIAVISAESALGDYGYVDVGAYMANFILSAESLGISTVVQGAVAEYSSVLRATLAIPMSQRVVATIAFGVEAPDDPANRHRTSRADLAETTRWLN